MATLYQSAGRVRKGVIAFVILAIFLILWGIISGLFNSTQITVDPEANRYFQIPDVALGQIPAPEIPSIEFNSDARFDQQSVHIQFLPDVGVVYKIEKPRQKFLAVERAEGIVTKLGFPLTSRQEGTDPNDLIWSKEDATRTVLYNKVNQTWNLSTNFRQNTSALSRKTLNSLDTYISRGASAVKTLDLDSFGFNSPTITATYTTYGVDGIFRDTQNQSEADYVFVDIIREIPIAYIKTEGLPVIPEGSEEIIVDQTAKVYSDDPRYGQIHFVASSDFGDISNDIYGFQFTDFEYDLNSTGVYPITTPDEAWVNVQRGQGSLVFVQPQGENYYGNFDSIEVRQFTADFRETELAYWEPKDWSGFVIPIYIFRGTATLEDGRLAEFTFYMDALKRV